MAAMLLVALMITQPIGTYATGAHVMLWIADMANVGEAKMADMSMFVQEHAIHGFNRYVMFASHPSQWWLTAYAVWLPMALSDVDDISCVLCRQNKAGLCSRIVSKLGYFSALFIIATLWPSAKKGTMPWLEVVAFGNNYAGEAGAKVTMRHHRWPRLWWNRVDGERSIPNGLDLYNTFTSMNLPRFIVGMGHNFAAWHPYHAGGPKFFTFNYSLNYSWLCDGWTMKDIFFAMFEEQKTMAENFGPSYEVSRKKLEEVTAIYDTDYEEGAWLTKEERSKLWERSKL